MVAMASAISYELLKSMQGQPGGLATLDSSGLIPVSQVPSSLQNSYKGEFVDTSALETAHPTGVIADYAYNDDTTSLWYWDAGADTPGWANQQITATAYASLSIASKADVPWVIIPG